MQWVGKLLLPIFNKKLIKRWDSERELFYDDIRHVLQRTIDLRQNHGENV